MWSASSDASRGYPHLNQGTNLAHLVGDGVHLNWTFFHGKDHGPDRLHIGQSRTIFPPTRSQRYSPKASIVKYAEQGANYIRTRLPDVDIPSELIRDEITRDMRTARKFSKFDPYAGNVLESIDVPDEVGSKQTFLAFPMGELFRDLNLSSFSQGEGDIVFEPSANPVKTFDTPIQQISASKSPSSGAFLSVRTFSNTSLLRIDPCKVPSLTELTIITQSDTGGRAPVDFLFMPSLLEILTVNDRGALYRCEIVDGQKYLDLVYSPTPRSVSRGGDAFWCLARAKEETSCLLASDKMLKLIDLKSKTTLDLFSMRQKGNVVTSVEDELDDHLIRLCTTDELIWIDRRAPGRPLLGYAHNRDFDRTLEARMFPSSESILLTSRKNGMITVYDMSHSGGLVHLMNEPYYLSPMECAVHLHLGQTIVSPLSETGGGAASCIRLSDRGSLYQIDMHRTPADFHLVFQTLWSTDVHYLAEQSSLIDVPHDDQEFIETDLSPLYNKLFNASSDDQSTEEKDSLDGLVDKICTLWQGHEAEFDHMLNTSEAVIQVGRGLAQSTCLDFWAANDVKTLGGYQSIMERCLPVKELVKEAPWHLNLSQILKIFDPDFTDDMNRCREGLKRYDLLPDPNRSASSIEQEREAREGLALDLVLSADVFGGKVFSRHGEDATSLEGMTRTLLLAGEPRPIDFGYLRPVPTTEKAEEVLQSAGARDLLKKWENGTDGTQEAGEGRGGQRGDWETVHSQPPLVVGREWDGWETVDFGASTQVLDGRHGGRKKKKKRLGGF